MASELDSLKREHRGCGKKVDEQQLDKIVKECDELRVRCQNLEREISSLNEELVGMDGSIQEKNEYIVTL